MSDNANMQAWQSHPIHISIQHAGTRLENLKTALTMRRCSAAGQSASTGSLQVML